VQQVALSQTTPVNPVTPADAIRSYGEAPDGVMPEWPSIDLRHAHRKLPPHEQEQPVDTVLVLALVQAVLEEPDPEAALHERLSVMQAAQQARFAALPDIIKSEDGTLLRHQRQLQMNQARHTAAVKLLRLISAWGP